MLAKIILSTMSSLFKSKNGANENPASRVTMLDAVDLDSEIQRILKEQLLRIFHTLSPSFAKWEPEFDTLLRIVIWKLSVWQFKATFGQQLLSVKYNRDFTSQNAALWAALSIGSRYANQRSPELTRFLVEPEHREKVKKAVEWLELSVQIASILNLLVFLRDGSFPTLPDRLVGARPVTVSTGSRVVGYSYMTRELLWHGFIELIVFVLPLVNFKYVQRRLRKWFGLQRSGRSKREVLVYTTSTSCAVCQEPPVLPHHMGCPHAFCYYCLQTNRMADAKFECPTCGHSVNDDSDVQPVTTKFCTKT